MKSNRSIVKSLSLHGLGLTLLLFASVIQLIQVSADDTYPANEYEYSVRREWMLEAERNFGPHSQVLTPDEEIVDHFLQYLKWREHQDTKTSGFPPSRPIEEKLQEIQSTEIYQALKKLPKGGNMHSHENHEVSKSTLFDIVWESEDFKYLYLGNPEYPETAWYLDFFAIEPPTENPVRWIRANETGYSKAEILQYNTLIGRMTFNATKYPTDSSMRWRLIDPLWESMAGNLINNINIKLKYIQAMYDHGMEEGVTYFETRKSFGGSERIYYLNPDQQYQDTLGKVFLESTNQESGDLEVELVRDFAANYSQTHGDFIGHKRISYTYRRQIDKESWRQSMENVARLYNKYPNEVLGFDTVGEEDAGYSHLNYLQNFLTLYDSTNSQSRVPLFLHVVETNWPEDLISSVLSDDPVATLNNAYEVLLLGAKRLGHATALIKHPYLMQIVRERNLAIEICVVSNQILGFTPDIRNHPGLHYYRSGIPIVFGADDPGTFGYDNFTVDWYEAYMGWGISLADLKQIALNSLNYSGMTSAEKDVAIEQRWRPQWNRYITAMKTQACNRDYLGEGLAENRSPSFARILPREGARIAGTRVHVFGRNFERAICKESSIRCKFGEKESTEAVYVTNEHIICVAPDSGLAAGQSLSVAVTITLDGQNFIPTGFNYTFIYDVITTTPAPTSGASRAHDLITYLLIIPLLIIHLLKD